MYLVHGAFFHGAAQAVARHTGKHVHAAEPGERGLHGGVRLRVIADIERQGQSGPGIAVCKMTQRFGPAGRDNGLIPVFKNRFSESFSKAGRTAGNKPCLHRVLSWFVLADAP